MARYVKELEQTEVQSLVSYLQSSSNPRAIQVDAELEGASIQIFIGGVSTATRTSPSFDIPLETEA